MSAYRGRPANTSQIVVAVIVSIAIFTALLIGCSWAVQP